MMNSTPCCSIMSFLPTANKFEAPKENVPGTTDMFEKKKQASNNNAGRSLKFRRENEMKRRDKSTDVFWQYSGRGRHHHFRWWLFYNLSGMPNYPKWSKPAPGQRHPEISDLTIPTDFRTSYCRIMSTIIRTPSRSIMALFPSAEMRIKR